MRSSADKTCQRSFHSKLERNPILISKYSTRTETEWNTSFCPIFSCIETTSPPRPTCFFPPSSWWGPFPPWGGPREARAGCTWSGCWCPRRDGQRWRCPCKLCWPPLTFSGTTTLYILHFYIYSNFFISILKNSYLHFILSFFLYICIYILHFFIQFIPFHVSNYIFMSGST